MYSWKTATYQDDPPKDWREIVVELATLADFEHDLRNNGIEPSALTLDDLDKLRDRFVDACGFSEAVLIAVEVFAEDYLGR